MVAELVLVSEISFTIFKVPAVPAHSTDKLLFSPRMFYSHYVLNQREDSTDAHLVAGRVLHCLLFEPEKYDDNFVSLPGKLPTDSQKKIIDNTFDALRRMFYHCKDKLKIDQGKRLVLDFTHYKTKATKMMAHIILSDKDKKLERIIAFPKLYATALGRMKPGAVCDPAIAELEDGTLYLKEVI